MNFVSRRQCRQCGEDKAGSPPPAASSAAAAATGRGRDSSRPPVLKRPAGGSNPSQGAGNPPVSAVTTATH
eukprot:3043541-Prorocentrum_lima.AAC.1